MALFDRPIGTWTYAAIRFGCGLPALGAPETPAEMLARLRGADRMAEVHPGPHLDALAEEELRFRELNKRFRRGETELEEQVKVLRRARQLHVIDAMQTELVRWAVTDDPFRERLVRFWGDHFTTSSARVHPRAGPAAMREEAIRPHIAGRFADLLIAAVLHPVMLMYLSQVGSVGPNSVVGLELGRGLNENLAREVLELHTLGVGGPYTQTDVRQFAELLTGLQYSLKHGFRFGPRNAEPGAEQVLGVSYGGSGPAVLDDIHQALEDIAVHPATAAHIARKLAVHFVSDDPDPDLVAQMAAAFRDTGSSDTKCTASLRAICAAVAGCTAISSRA